MSDVSDAGDAGDVLDVSTLARPDGTVTPADIGAHCFPQLPAKRQGQIVRNVLRDAMPRKAGEPVRRYKWHADADAEYIRVLVAAVSKRGTGGARVTIGATEDSFDALAAML